LLKSNWKTEECICEAFLVPNTWSVSHFVNSKILFILDEINNELTK